MTTRGAMVWKTALVLAFVGLLLVTSGIFATARTTEQVATDASVVQRADRVIASAWTTERLLDQAILVSDAWARGVADERLRAAAISEVRESAEILSEDTTRLVAEWDEGGQMLLAEVATMSASATITLASLDSGDVAGATSTATQAEAAIGRLVEVTRAERDRRSADIALAGDQAARIAVATRWVVALFLPGLAALALRQTYRRHTERVLLEKELEREKQVRSAKDQFLAAVVHHLRTPLTSVVGFAQVLREGRRSFSSGQRNEMIETLADEAADLGELIEDLHVAARSDPDSIAVDMALCDMRRIAESVAAALGAAHDEQLSISGQGLANADPFRVRQILRHLADNALKHGRNRAAIAIRSEHDRLVIEVTDDGRGLPEDVAQTVFNKRDTPVEAPASLLAIGVGLGLSRRLAERMGGQLGYERRGELTVMSLTLVKAERPVVEKPTPRRNIEIADVLHAIQSDPPKIALQPVLDLSSVAREQPVLVGFEALSRFPRGTPPEWFGAAADAGIKVDLELVAIRAAVEQVAKLSGSAFLALNVSTETLLSSSLLETVQALPPERVVFELSEDAAVSSYERAKDVVALLRQRGYRLALDDVGSGEMDLWHVLRLRPAIVKLDISLVQDVAVNAETYAIVEALVVFANRMSAHVIAEGIETESELQVLRRLGILWGQGYYLGRPHTPEDPEYAAYEFLAQESERVSLDT